jgi:hypothetical protein
VEDFGRKAMKLRGRRLEEAMVHFQPGPPGEPVGNGGGRLPPELEKQERDSEAQEHGASGSAPQLVEKRLQEQGLYDVENRPEQGERDDEPYRPVLGPDEPCRAAKTGESLRTMAAERVTEYTRERCGPGG